MARKNIIQVYSISYIINLNTIPGHVSTLTNNLAKFRLA